MYILKKSFLGNQIDHYQVVIKSSHHHPVTTSILVMGCVTVGVTGQITVMVFAHNVELKMSR